jgi:hypothetical protein
VDEALAQFSKGVARRALLAAAAHVAEAIRPAAPVDTGALRGGIHFVFACAKGAAGGSVGEALIAARREAKATGATTTLAEVNVMAAAEDHAHLEEFGAEHHPVQRFIKPG